MKILFILLSFGLFSFQTSDISSIRKAFQIAHESIGNAQKFNTLVTNSTTLSAPLKQAYTGASQILLSKFAQSISSKLSNFKEGKMNIEKALKSDGDNIEIHLIRLVVQTKTPDFLGYNGKKDTDKKFIIAHFSAASSTLKTFIKKVGKDTHCFSDIELQELK